MTQTITHPRMKWPSVSVANVACITRESPTSAIFAVCARTARRSRARMLCHQGVPSSMWRVQRQRTCMLRPATVPGRALHWAHHMLGQGIQKHIGRLDVVVYHLCARTRTARISLCSRTHCTLSTQKDTEFSRRKSSLQVLLCRYHGVRGDVFDSPWHLSLLRTLRLCKNASPRATSNRIFVPTPYQPSLPHTAYTVLRAP